MCNTIIVRALGVAEIDDYMAIRLAALRLAPEAFGAVYASEAAGPATQHAERLTSSTVFGAYDGARIVGMIGLKQEEGLKGRHTAFVWGLYVHAGDRLHGVASGLLSALLAAAAGIVEQVTLTVAEGNTAAIALYERAGFTRYGVEPRALKTEADYTNEVSMTRFLHDH